MLFSRYEVRGYAVVSDDGMIADACGTMPSQLQNKADWDHFQSELDLAQLVLVGRRSHEASPSTGRRLRLVASRSAGALEHRDHAWWWNPAVLKLEDVLAQMLPMGGRIAVPGGQGVFDLLAGLRAFDQFHLTRAIGVELAHGTPAFSAQSGGMAIEAVLHQLGLYPDPAVTLDASPRFELYVWRARAQAGRHGPVR